MPIAKGEDWGAPGALPPGGVVARNDAEARAAVTAAHRQGCPIPPIGLLGGDLWRTLGGRSSEERLRSGQAARFSCDLGAALLDGRLHWFVSHLVARRPAWRGQIFVAMNAAWFGRWNLGPRAHPGDGLLDTYEADLPPSQRLMVRSRLPQGAHLPHPGIRGRRVRALQVGLERPLPVRLDGEVVQVARQLSLRVEPAALTVVV